MNYNNSLSLWNFDENFLESRLSKLSAELDERTQDAGPRLLTTEV